MDRWEIGMLAKSLAGHDKDKIYLITEIDESYVYLVDGHLKTYNNRKKKKKIHVQIIKEKHEVTGLDDAGARRILKEYADRNEGGYKNV